MSNPANPPPPDQAGYGYAPPYGSPPQPTRLRGRRSIQVGIVLAVVGLVLTITGAVLAATRSYGKVNDFQRVPVSAGTGTVTFNKSGGYVAYYESASVTNSTNQRIPIVEGQLTNQATGEVVRLNTPYGGRSDGKIKLLHYDYNGHKGLAMWQFHINQPGTYDVQLLRNPLADSDAVVAFGRSIAQGVVLGGIFVIVGVLLLIAGVITLIVGVVLRSRHKTQIRISGGYGGSAAWPQPAGTPGGWPPPASQQGDWPPPASQQGGWPDQQGGWPQGPAPGSQPPGPGQQPGAPQTFGPQPPGQQPGAGQTFGPPAPRPENPEQQ